MSKAKLSNAIEELSLAVGVDYAFGELDVIQGATFIVNNLNGIINKQIAHKKKAEEHLISLQNAVDDLLTYRRDNTLNFQLEKLDDYLRVIANALKGGDL